MEYICLGFVCAHAWISNLNMRRSEYTIMKIGISIHASKLDWFHHMYTYVHICIYIINYTCIKYFDCVVRIKHDFPCTCWKVGKYTLGHRTVVNQSVQVHKQAVAVFNMGAYSTMWLLFLWATILVSNFHSGWVASWWIGKMCWINVGKPRYVFYSFSVGVVWC
jgi:hypothetical protein